MTGLKAIIVSGLGSWADVISQKLILTVQHTICTRNSYLYFRAESVLDHNNCDGNVLDTRKEESLFGTEYKICFFQTYCDSSVLYTDMFDSHVFGKWAINI